LQIYWLPKVFVGSFIFKLQVSRLLNSGPFIRN
jgi:hypothetical protein